MKKLLVLALLLPSCASLLGTSSKTGPEAGLCEPFPETLYGIPKADCKPLDGLGACCAYSAELDEAWGGAMTCGYLLCRKTCNSPLALGFAMCMPTPAPADPSDETL